MADARPCRLRRLHLAHAGRAAHRAAARAHNRSQAPADRAALEIEREVGKPGTLDRYLTLAPFGGNLEGVRAASLAYFGKEPLRLTIAEAALLVALPQSPEARRPDRSPGAARAARDRVLDRVEARGLSAPPMSRQPSASRSLKGALAFRRSPRMPRKKRSPPTSKPRSSSFRSTRGCRRSSRRWRKRASRVLGRNCLRRSSSSTTQLAKFAPG